LRLLVVNENVVYEEDDKCHTTKFFSCKKVELWDIVDEVHDLAIEDNVNDYCRLYIVIGLTKIYFPNTNPNGFLRLFKILDDLKYVEKYN